MFIAFPGCWSLPPPPSPEAVPQLPPTPPWALPRRSSTRKQDLSLLGHDKHTFIYCTCEMKLEVPPGPGPLALALRAQGLPPW